MLMCSLKYSLLPENSLEYLPYINNDLAIMPFDDGQNTHSFYFRTSSLASLFPNEV